MFDCGKCGGSGTVPFRLANGVCFACGGSGKVAKAPRNASVIAPVVKSALRQKVEAMVKPATASTERQIRDVETGPYAGSVSILVCGYNESARQIDSENLSGMLAQRGFEIARSGSRLWVR